MVVVVVELCLYEGNKEMESLVVFLCDYDTAWHFLAVFGMHACMRGSFWPVPCHWLIPGAKEYSRVFVGFPHVSAIGTRECNLPG